MVETKANHIPGYDFASAQTPRVRSFLLLSGRNEEELQRMQDGWTRAILLSITLWVRPYSTADLW